jgi:ATP-dependent exoDNAse (exonuclease V) beta subunit
MSVASFPPDQQAREAIVAETRRNVAVIAGAGTGKTKTIIERAVALLAPAGTAAPMPIQRMALLTFTRRAAGELRFRIREELLRALEREARRDGARAQRLRDALANLDAAFIGTIHGFADRLLRLRPVEAALSPAYTLIEDTAELVHETFVRLRRAADAGTLAAELGPMAAGLDPALLGNAAETLRRAARAGMQMQRAEAPFGPAPSFEGLLARMIETRDVVVDLPAVPDPGLADARVAVQLLGRNVEAMRGRAFGHRRLRRIFRALRRLERTDDPADAARVVQEALAGRPLYKSHDFDNDAFAWAIYKQLFPSRPSPGSLGSKLRGPHRWLAAQLVRLFPVARAMYECVKAEHEVVDYVDLLIKLRDLLRDDVSVRRFYQGLFDHIFVDEFQDTDPLQSEIVFFLCEDASGPAAARWDAVDLAPGRLTIVGDPKQSIYRFRRADIITYGRALERLGAGGALSARLETNFRSRPELIRFFNEQLAKVLGQDDGPAFDPRTGRANYEALRAGGTPASGGAAVHLLPYADAAGSGLVAATGRPIEAQMLARYIRWLHASRLRVRDPDSGCERPIEFGDIAVLARATTNLPLLLRELDVLGIPYAARGGVLLLDHPLVRRYLLGLRALADRDDGVAQAALLCPPFFALDLADIVADRAGTVAGAAMCRARVEEAQAIVTDLRLRRHRQSAGATARDLIERTALARTVISGDNGAQTLAALYEVAAELDRRAALEQLDFDAVTEHVREWAAAPVFLDAPEPLHASAVRVLTIHGAKGLEFPVVVLWDGFQVFSDTAGAGVWEVDRDGLSWVLSVGAVAVEQPPGAHLLDREKQLAEQERRRMYYVAATRARDLLAVPLPLTKGKARRYATHELAWEVDPTLVERFETFVPGQLPLWSRFDTPTRRRRLVADADLQGRLERARQGFEAALRNAAQQVARPMAVTQYVAHAETREEAADEVERVAKVAASRFGSGFGITVHRALELVLSGAISDSRRAVALAVEESGLADHVAEAEADVERSLAALRAVGAGGNDAFWTVRTEYPLAVAWENGTLLSGFIDLLVLSPDSVTVLDYKTDAPRSGALAAAYPRYAEQLRIYVEMLRRAEVIGTRRVRAGLLLTASGEIRWDEERLQP